MIIGLISDTHGLLRTEAAAALNGSDMIFHAGDIDDRLILKELERIAPVCAVRGNMDFKPEVAGLPEFIAIESEGLMIGVIHDLQRLKIDPAAENLSAVIFGHSHRPAVEEKNGIWYVNPGSAGPRRFRLPVTVGRLVIKNEQILPEIIEIGI